MQVAALELERLGHRLAPEGAEDHPPRVDRGQERADVAGHVQRPLPAALLADDEQDLVLGEEAREGRDARQRQAADDEAAVGEGHRAAEAAHPVQRLLAAHRADHRARGHEEQRLEERVRHQVEQPGDVGAGADRHDHVADLRHRRVGDDALEVGDDEADRARHEQRDGADDRADRGGRRGELEQRVHAGDQVDAGRHHRGRVDQRGDRRRALHGVGQPCVQRDLRALGERAHEQQDQAGHEVALVAAELLAGGLEGAQEVQRAGVLEDEVRPEHEPDVAEHVDDERLDAGLGGRRAPVPERDQQVRRRTDERPADDQDQEVAGQDEHQHREHEEVQVGEEARVAAVRGQVGDRVEVDQRRHAADHERHEHAERVDEDRQRAVDADRVRVVPRREDDLALLLAAVLEGEERHHGGHERGGDGQRADRAHDARRPGAEAEAEDDGSPAAAAAG